MHTAPDDGFLEARSQASEESSRVSKVKVSGIGGPAGIPHSPSARVSLSPEGKTPKTKLQMSDFQIWLYDLQQRMDLNLSSDGLQALVAMPSFFNLTCFEALLTLVRTTGKGYLEGHNKHEEDATESESVKANQVFQASVSALSRLLLMCVSRDTSREVFYTLICTKSQPDSRREVMRLLVYTAKEDVIGDVRVMALSSVRCLAECDRNLALGEYILVNDVPEIVAQDSMAVVRQMGTRILQVVSLVRPFDFNLDQYCIRLLINCMEQDPSSEVREVCVRTLSSIFVRNPKVMMDATKYCKLFLVLRRQLSVDRSDGVVIALLSLLSACMDSSLHSDDNNVELYERFVKDCGTLAIFERVGKEPSEKSLAAVRCIRTLVEHAPSRMEFGRHWVVSRFARVSALIGMCNIAQKASTGSPNRIQPRGSRSPEGSPSRRSKSPGISPIKPKKDEVLYRALRAECVLALALLGARNSLSRSLIEKDLHALPVWRKHTNTLMSECLPLVTDTTLAKIDVVDDYSGVILNDRVPASAENDPFHYAYELLRYQQEQCRTGEESKPSKPRQFPDFGQMVNVSSAAAQDKAKSRALLTRALLLEALRLVLDKDGKPLQAKERTGSEHRHSGHDKAPPCSTCMLVAPDTGEILPKKGYRVLPKEKDKPWMKGGRPTPTGPVYFHPYTGKKPSVHDSLEKGKPRHQENTIYIPATSKIFLVPKDIPSAEVPASSPEHVDVAAPTAVAKRPHSPSTHPGVVEVVAPQTANSKTPKPFVPPSKNPPKSKSGKSASRQAAEPAEEKKSLNPLEEFLMRVNQPEPHARASVRVRMHDGNQDGEDGEQRFDSVRSTPVKTPSKQANAPARESDVYYDKVGGGFARRVKESKEEPAKPAKEKYEPPVTVGYERDIYDFKIDMQALSKDSLVEAAAVVKRKTTRMKKEMLVTPHHGKRPGERPPRYTLKYLCSVGNQLVETLERLVDIVTVFGDGPVRKAAHIASAGAESLNCDNLLWVEPMIEDLLRKDLEDHAAATIQRHFRKHKGIPDHYSDDGGANLLPKKDTMELPVKKPSISYDQANEQKSYQSPRRRASDLTVKVINPNEIDGKGNEAKPKPTTKKTSAIPSSKTQDGKRASSGVKAAWQQPDPVRADTQSAAPSTSAHVEYPTQQSKGRVRSSISSVGSSAWEEVSTSATAAIAASRMVGLEGEEVRNRLGSGGHSRNVSKDTFQGHFDAAVDALNWFGIDDDFSSEATGPAQRSGKSAQADSKIFDWDDLEMSFDEVVTPTAADWGLTPVEKGARKAARDELGDFINQTEKIINKTENTLKNVKHKTKK